MQLLELIAARCCLTGLKHCGGTGPYRCRMFPCFRAYRPRKPVSIKVTRFLHCVTGLAIPVAPCKDSTKHGCGVAAALLGSCLWLLELTDGSPGCSCPCSGSNAVVCQHSALWRAKPCCRLNAGPREWPQECPVCAAVPSAPVQEVLSLACPAPAS